jgi:2'-5' RNA ligase
MHGVGFSLWIVPEGEVRRRLAVLIEALARRFGGPVFEPHLTLLAGAPGPTEAVVARAEELVRGSQAFRIGFTGPETGESYFRSLYLRVEPSPELLALHVAARDAFGRVDEPPFFPHLSLMYGAAPASAFVEEMGCLAPDGCEARTLDVYSTEGEVEGWHPVRRLRLGGQNSRAGES